MNSLIRKLAGLLGALSLALATSACTGGKERPVAALPTPVQSAAAAPVAPSDGPALWRVSDEDTTIYLFGTVHALPKDAVWMNDGIAAALGQADELVTEVPLDQKQGVRADMLARAVLPDGQTLRQLLGEADLRAYERAMGSLGLPMATFDRFEPWYAAMAMSLLPMAKQGFSADAGVEAVLNARFDPARKRGALETVEYQLSLFDALPQDTQVSYLHEVADGVPEMGTMIRQMVAAWLKGDADGLAKLMNSDTSDPVLLDRLLYQRNLAWAKWIEARLAQPGTVFLAVGAGHLAGQGSVQDALAHEGIRTARLQ
jgi:uncharacterized protein YbaP (TraB family)